SVVSPPCHRRLLCDGAARPTSNLAASGELEGKTMPEPTERGWQVEARAQTAASKLEIAVHDVIGKSFWDDGGVTSKDFLASLRSTPDAKEIDLRVNSIGGIVDEAKGMRNLLLERAA